MFKNWVSLLLLICFKSISAQQPFYFPNAYVYGERENVRLTNFSLLRILPAGQLSAASYQNGNYFIANNSTYFLVPPGSYDILNSHFIIIGRDSFFINSTSLVNYSNGKFHPVIAKPDTIKTIQEISGGIVYNAKRGGGWRMEKFDGKKFTAFGTENSGAALFAKSPYSEKYVAVSIDSSKIKIIDFEPRSLRCFVINEYPLLKEQKGKHFSYVYVAGKDSLILVFDNSFFLVTNDINKKYLTDQSNILGGLNGILLTDGIRNSGIMHFPKSGMEKIIFPFIDKIQDFVLDTLCNSIYVGTYNKLYRLFNHIRQYPGVFNSKHSSAIQGLQQSEDGIIWAGSYNGLVSKIYENRIEQFPDWSYRILNGGMSFNNGALLISEGGSVDKSGIFFLKNKERPIQISKNSAGFYLYRSLRNNKIYYGTAGGKGLWITDSTGLKSGNPSWDTIDSKKGMGLLNILTITEDRQGRIWMARNNQGISIYYPTKDKAVTFLIEKKQISFGAMCSLTDSYGTVWLGGKQGLWFYDNSKIEEVKESDIKRLPHPLLQGQTNITFMKQWGKWLVLGANDKILLLNLDQWNESKGIVLRYLNPQETNFTNPTEQNTALIDKRDSSLWFSTSDMLYQLDLKKWLSLPTFKVHPGVVTGINDKNFSFEKSSEIDVSPTENTLRFNVSFQTRDNMPRYITGALIKKGDSMILPAPSLQTSFSYANLRSGSYIFYLQIFEQDGTTSTYQYGITINKFLWQKWWFWLLVSSFIILVVLFIINAERKKQLAIEKAKRIAAEADALKSEQNRQLIRMQVVSMSNQFRPHFILNALNTLGAQLYDKPEIDKMIGNLGDSINIIFKNAQKGIIAHALSEEWKLIEMVMSVKQLEYRSEIEIETDSQYDFNSSAVMLPMGLLQIPVENAFIHGLRNKEKENKKLWINALDNHHSLTIKIIDNGIGRKAASQISNYRSNGVGLKNLLAIIELLNKHNTEKLKLHFEDDLFETEGVKHGTAVIVVIPKSFNYEID